MKTIEIIGRNFCGTAAHESYAAVSEEKRGSYQREDRALTCFREEYRLIFWGK